MRTRYWLAGMLLAGCGCANMNNTEKDSLGGAAAGAGAMALLTRGNPVAAVFGGLFGGLIGASIGNRQDHIDDRQKAIAQAQADAAARQMSITDIVQMSQRKVSDGLIIGQMDATASWFSLRADDIQYLKDQGVSDAVVSAMQARRYPRAVVVAPGPVIYGPPGPVIYAPPPGPVVVYDQGPPPLVPTIGVGVGIGR